MSVCRSFTNRSVRRNGGFIWQKIEEQREMRYEQIVKKAEGLKAYLEENLFESQYTFSTAGSSRLTIGVPSAKQFDKVEKLCREYGEEDVAVEMRLVPLFVQGAGERTKGNPK